MPKLYERDIPLIDLRNIEFEGKLYKAGYSQKIYNKGEPIYFIIKNAEINEEVEFRVNGQEVTILSKQGDLVYKSVIHSIGPKRSTFEIINNRSGKIKKEIFEYEIKELNLNIASSSNSYLYYGIKNEININAFGYNCAYPKIRIEGGILSTEGGKYYIEANKSVDELTVKLNVGDDSISRKYAVIDIPKPTLQIILEGESKCLSLKKLQRPEIYFKIHRVEAFSKVLNENIELRDSFCFLKRDSLYLDKIIFSNNKNTKLDTLVFN